MLYMLVYIQFMCYKSPCNVYWSLMGLINIWISARNVMHRGLSWHRNLLLNQIFTYYIWGHSIVYSCMYHFVFKNHDVGYKQTMDQTVLTPDEYEEGLQVGWVIVARKSFPLAYTSVISDTSSIYFFFPLVSVLCHFPWLPSIYEAVDRLIITN